MATLYAKAAGGNYSAAATWSNTSSAGADSSGPPTNADDVIFDSGAVAAVTVDTTTCVAKTVTFQSASNAIVFTAAKVLYVWGSYTQFAGMSVTGTGILGIYASGTITSAGITFPGGMYFATATVTLADNWTVTGLVLSTATLVLNGNQLTSGGIVVNGTTSGTTNIILSGGTWSGSNTTGIANNLTLGAAATMSGNVYYRTGTLTNNMNAGGAGTSILWITGNCTIGGSGSWYNAFSSTAVTVTLTNNLTALATISIVNGFVFTGAYNLACNILLLGGTTAKTLTWQSGTTITVTTAILAGNIAGGSKTSHTLSAGTASSPAYLVYNGTQANCVITGAIFTDIDASGSVRKLYNYQGGALTRTVNIENVVLPPATFPTVNGCTFIRGARS